MGFSPKILSYLATTAVSGTGIYLTVKKHRAQTIEDLLLKERKTILEDGDAKWSRKIRTKGIEKLLGEEVSEGRLWAKCRELLKIPLMDIRSFRGEREARKWCIEEEN